MRKFVIIIFIFLLIFSTAIIKNSTKKIEDEIFVVKESLRDLENKLDDITLEFEYLSSNEKLLEHQSKYFEENLIQKSINTIKTLTNKSNNLSVGTLNISQINEKK